MIKILTFIPLPRSSRGIGGTEEYAYSLIDELRKQQFEVSFVTSRVGDLESPSDSSSNSKSSFSQLHDMVDSSSRAALLLARAAAYIDSSLILLRPVPKFSCLFLFPKIIGLVKQSDIIHIHMPYPFVEAYISFLAKLIGKKIVVTYHMDARLDSESGTESGTNGRSKASLRDRIIEKLYYYFSSRYPLSGASVICSNTRAYALESPILRKCLSKVYVVYQGINEQLFRQLDMERAVRLRSNLLQDKYEYIVSFVGRLVPYKGIPYLLQAVKIINETTDLKIHFVIGGTGREKLRLVELSQQLGLTNVSFIGYVEDKDLFNLYTASDIVVSPSISSLESTPISLLSALSCGTPVIGTSIGGTEETVPNDGERAEIIVPRNAKEIALSITKLLGANIKSTMRTLNEKKPLIQLRFWSNVATDYGDLFLGLTKQGSVIRDGQIAL